ncbi:RagB/SusD family nutrient uptake outer membrane protein [Moheibacter sediminis]|uniref:SusD family protein n=1 Tax=Moheibacter sediminis TaxID=1434700 RepID=A0A1W2BD90_9FLAO|nr:RagB/SusD family nutrient uptake outer membrane protein [Moheibacter sediminis]SMC70937.1 SusD family protein [Moheibacter sediminis]
MKKFLIILLALFATQIMTSCSEDELDIKPEYLDNLDTIDTEEKLQMFLNGAYLSITNVQAYGAEALMFGDLLSDQMFSSSYLNTANFSYNELVNDFSTYGHMYAAILRCNLVINNDLVDDSENVSRIKAEAKILRAFAYFHLISTYSATPTSGLNQEYGVPIVLGDFDITIQPARSTVAEVYDQIISDLQAGIQGAHSAPEYKNYLSQTAAKLILSRVYLTRRAAGDAELALQYATEVVNSSPSVFAPISTVNAPISGADYVAYFNANLNAVTENRPETIWELDLNFNNSASAGIGGNLSLSSYYERTGTRRSFLFTQSFFASFGDNVGDVRKGLFTAQGVPPTDSPTGLWTTKWTRNSESGNFVRDIKILRFAEAQLNRIEALYLTGQTGVALTELNDFATSRGGLTYTGSNLLNDILTERYKEFFAEGHRFYDLKRYNLPIVRTTNCNTCELPANDLRFVFPMDEGVLNQNSALTQYPGY